MTEIDPELLAELQGLNPNRHDYFAIHPSDEDIDMLMEASVVWTSFESPLYRRLAALRLGSIGMASVCRDADPPPLYYELLDCLLNDEDPDVRRNAEANRRIVDGEIYATEQYS